MRALESYSGTCQYSGSLEDLHFVHGIPPLRPAFGAIQADVPRVDRGKSDLADATFAVVGLVHISPDLSIGRHLNGKRFREGPFPPDGHAADFLFFTKINSK